MHYSLSAHRKQNYTGTEKNDVQTKKKKKKKIIIIIIIIITIIIIFA